MLRFQSGLGSYDVWYCAIYNQNMVSHIGVLVALATMYGRDLEIQETPVFNTRDWKRVCAGLIRIHG